VCGENWHDPVKCNLLRKWIKKCDDDSETSNWIAANTKVILQILIIFMNLRFQENYDDPTYQN